MTVTGIDVSAFQGDFNWADHRDISFAGIRATSWTTATAFTDDVMLKHNANDTWDVYGGKVSRFYYHETRCAASDPGVQAKQFLGLLGRHLCLGDVMVAAMGDNGGNGSMGPGEIARWHGDFMHELRVLTGKAHRVICYCNPAWAEAGNCEGLGGWGLWLASYDVAEPSVPRPWKRYVAWQSSGTGLDRDVYNGSLRDLQDWAGMPTYRR
jgi:GH25 family lysozyme M1 (1,4-beta-N-acetylmuramidase)